MVGSHTRGTDLSGHCEQCNSASPWVLSEGLSPRGSAAGMCASTSGSGLRAGQRPPRAAGRQDTPVS